MNIFKIRPYIEAKDSKFNTFFTEIYDMPLDLIQDGIDSCNMVMSEQQDELWWGLEVSSVCIHKENARLTYYDEFVADLPTIDLRNMLVSYRKKLIEYEEENYRNT